MEEALGTVRADPTGCEQFVRAAGIMGVKLRRQVEPGLPWASNS